jgi:predicted component of type VI protein secretion system
MFEQMATRYQGRAIPAHISAGLEESREALAQAENELAALQGAAQSGPPAEATATPAADVTLAAAVTPPAEAALVASAPEPTPEPATAAPMPASAPTETPAPSVATVVPPASPEPAPMPVLKPRLMITASGAAVELPTDKQTIVVGREDPISGIFPEVDLTPHGGEGGGVSRQHARILHDGNGWKVEDLNSTNYTKINGTKLAPNTPTEIHDGDTLHFGRVALTIHS